MVKGAEWLTDHSRRITDTDLLNLTCFKQHTHLLICEDEQHSVSELILGEHPEQLLPRLVDSLPVVAVHYKDEPCESTHTHLKLTAFHTFTYILLIVAEERSLTVKRKNVHTGVQHHAQHNTKTHHSTNRQKKNLTNLSKFTWKAERSVSAVERDMEPRLHIRSLSVKHKYNCKISYQKLKPNKVKHWYVGLNNIWVGNGQWILHDWEMWVHAFITVMSKRAKAEAKTAF